MVCQVHIVGVECSSIQFRRSVKTKWDMDVEAAAEAVVDTDSGREMGHFVTCHHGNDQVGYTDEVLVGVWVIGQELTHQQHHK